jgi:hypothetical protein
MRSAVLLVIISISSLSLRLFAFVNQRLAPFTQLYSLLLVSLEVRYCIEDIIVMVLLQDSRRQIPFSVASLFDIL